MRKFFSFRVACVSTVFVSLALFFFSFTQVDLNLTLSQFSIFQTVQKFFIHIGYFQRPLSTTIYVSILIAMFLLYGFLLTLASKRMITQRQVWILIFILVGCLVLSYPAFSYDMFNYLFTAKTVLLYHKNPYTVIPLQFAGVDPFLTFMRWTHLPSAYTPLWISLSLVPYLFGFGYFLVILWNFKILMAAFYLLAAWAIWRVMHVLKKEDALTSLVFFAFNPLIIIESLVSGHNDIVMMGLCMVGILFLVRKQWWSALVLLSLSVGLKLMTIFIFPWALYFWLTKKTVQTKHVYVAVGLFLLAFVLVGIRREFLPWYLVWILPFAALVSTNLIVSGSVIGASMGLLLAYSPYLYYGNWDGAVGDMRLLLGLVPLGVGVLLGCVLTIKRTKGQLRYN